jgi:ATP-dependent Clp protease adaptor protein ClpS
MAGRTTEKPRPRDGTEVRSAPRYKVLLHNDDVNGMSYVARALQEVFGFEPAKAYSVMMTAHTQGVALCKVEPREPAEFHSERLISAGLTSTIEPE